MLARGELRDRPISVRHAHGVRLTEAAARLVSGGCRVRGGFATGHPPKATRHPHPLPSVTKRASSAPAVTLGGAGGNASPEQRGR
jgi:hypothetical protein